MPGLIGSQGVRPGALNMNRVFRALRYRTEQAQLVTYHRPAIYDTDDYGVPTGTSAAVPELLLPNLPAIIRPGVTADYMQERAGSSIIGTARIYTPNITTIKNYANFDQDNNTNFNEIEGWDRLITNYRTIYSVPTSATGSWTSGTADYTFTSDGETLSATMGAGYDGSFYFTTSAVNTLEADRLRFKIKASTGSCTFTNFIAYNGGTQDTDYATTYAPASLTSIPTGSWLTVDVPWITGTVASGTSIYESGTRYATTVTSGSSYDYESDLRDLEFNISGTSDGDAIYLKEIEFYKSVSWHVHSLKDMTDGYIIFNCVRTRGRIDSRRRAYTE